jgi:hypothetical protein
MAVPDNARMKTASAAVVKRFRSESVWGGLIEDSFLGCLTLGILRPVSDSPVTRR